MRLISMLFIPWLIFLTSGCSLNTPHREKSIKIKIAYLPVIQALPLFLAIQKGYFKEAGLEVEAVRFENPNQIIDSLLSGNVDFGSTSAATGITAISQFRNPDSLKIFALSGGSLPNHLDHSLLVKKNSSISNIQGLKGKTLATLPGIQWRTIATAILKRNGLQPGKNVELVQLMLPLQLEALASGQVDAILTLEPIVTIGKLQNIARDLIPGAAAKFIADPFFAGCGVVPTPFAAKHPETTTALLKIFNKAIEDIRQHPDEARQYLKNFTPLNDQQIKAIPLPLWKMVSELQPEDLQAAQKFIDIFTQYGVISGKVDIHSILWSR